MSSISLTSNVRSALSALQDTATLQATTNNHLATGKKVSSALDNPVNFFTAQGLNSRSSQLTSLLDGMSNGIQTIQAANKGITSITSVIQQLQSLVKTARQDSTGAAGTLSDVRKNAANQYNDLLKQVDTIAKDSGYNGTNLLGADTLKVVFNEKTGTDASTTSVTANKADGTAFGAMNYTALGLTTADTSATPATGQDWSSNTDLDTISDNLTKALSTLQTQAAQFGTALALVQTRQDFTKGIADVLTTGANNLTDADMNQEAANSQALSTRNSLAISALSLANTANQGVLQLLR